jgi:hypothetical protein
VCAHTERRVTRVAAPGGPLLFDHALELLVQLNNMHGALWRVPGPSFHGSSCERFFYPPLHDIAVFAPALAAGASSFAFTCVRGGLGGVTSVLEFARARQTKKRAGGQPQRGLHAAIHRRPVV